MRIKYARKLSFSCIDVQQTFSFPFSLLKHYQMPFELMQQYYHATEIRNVGNAVVVSACADQS